MSTDDIDDALLLALGALVRKQISADELLGRIVDVMADLLDADRGTLYLVDRDTDELVSIAAHLPEMPELRVPLSQGVAGYVGRTGKVVNVPRSEDDARFWKKIDEATGYQTDTMLCGPVFDSSGELIGVVQLLNKRDGEFDDDDEELLEVLARQAASLLEQTTLPDRPRLIARPERAQKTSPRPTLAERFNGVVASGEKMAVLLGDIRRVATTEATVLLRGESGTGKTLLAQTIHDNSTRRSEPFVVVDCTTLPDGLIENELFGHERGAYTGATTRAEGKVAAADGGTLFLDEVGDLPLGLQGKLLALLQNRTYMPVGSTERREADIRIVAATNRELEELVRAGEFREDLYYRLRVVELEVPSLRERSAEDLTSLIEHFVAKAARRHGRSIERIRDDALQLLLDHRWPGNVRELENCLEAAVIFADREITADLLSLPTGLSERSSDGPFNDEPTMDELEARYITYLLRKNDGNRSATARTMKIGRNTLIRKLKEYDIDE